jgi:hypothetical protein
MGKYEPSYARQVGRGYVFCCTLEYHTLAWLCVVCHLYQVIVCENIMQWVIAQHLSL